MAQDYSTISKSILDHFLVGFWFINQFQTSSNFRLWENVKIILKSMNYRMLSKLNMQLPYVLFVKHYQWSWDPRVCHPACPRRIMWCEELIDRHDCMDCCSCCEPLLYLSLTPSSTGYHDIGSWINSKWLTCMSNTLNFVGWSRLVILWCWCCIFRSMHKNSKRQKSSLHCVRRKMTFMSAIF